jgi:predicted RNA binding protein YcfA (HicA-like mRNA interferase family)
MPAPETNRRKVVTRLEREGWLLKEGGEHTIYKREDRPGVRIVVPRHAELSPGVARSIAKLAGWK